MRTERDDGLSFETECRAILNAALEGLQQDSHRIAGVEGCDEKLPGLSGRSERHFQAAIFSGLTARGRRVTVEDQYYGTEGVKGQEADLAVELSDGRWLWMELKRFLPGNVGFASAGDLRHDVAKLSVLAKKDRRNLPQGLLVVLLRDSSGQSDDLEAVWCRRVSELTDPFSFCEYRLARIPFSDEREGDMLIGLWARDTG